jgi:hypothetical protein
MRGALSFAQIGPHTGPPGEGAVDERRRAGGVRRIVPVDLRGPRVGVAHPLLDRAQRHLAAASCVPKVWRSSWKVISRTRARPSAFRNRLRTFEASSTWPVSGWEKTRSSSSCQRERWKSRSSSRATRSAIGTDRPVCDLGESALSTRPRGKLSATRTSPATQSTSRRLSASNSPCRKPVIAAVR